ncbi:MAG: bifunctional phosphopantothenoylcysteine decarboxylase/phosphopantothenate--cysteine ligase CoaBC [Acidimicrobiales bacterium]
MTSPVEPAVPGRRDAPAGPEHGPDRLDGRSLSGARVVLGVSGGIAAYKAVEVCRRLVELGAHVVPVLTEGALRFVGEATFSALGSERARTALYGDADPIPHTHLGRQADLVVVAPATARVIGSYAAGISADLLVATLLATRSPVLICPAMHAEMWDHPAVRENLALLKRRGTHVVEPAVGPLAGGDVGPGRLADPAEIVAAAQALLRAAGFGGDRTGAAPFARRRDLAGRTVLVTAGGTREAIDAVRYIANRSSGKQGHALAEAASARGAQVVLVTTTDLPAAPGVEVVKVESAAEMADAVLGRAADQDLVVMAAAVADFRPGIPAPSKLHKSDGIPRLVLEETLDILAELGRRRRSGQVLVGFAAETDSVVERAARKLRSKGVDLVVANDVGKKGVGFAYDTNAVSIVSADSVVDVPLSSKRAVADAILDVAVDLLGEPAPS